VLFLNIFAFPVARILNGLHKHFVG